MNRTRRHPSRAFLTALITAVLVTLPALLASAKPTPLHGPTTKQQFKNIQVLQDLPADQMIPVMREWSGSLGVRCDFCHVREGRGGPGNHAGFEKDTKPEKQAARKMFRMVQDLNAHQKILGKKATCFMCHHGHAEPETKLAFRGGPGGFPGRGPRGPGK